MFASFRWSKDEQVLESKKNIDRLHGMKHSAWIFAVAASLSLSACLQDHAAPIEYRGDMFFGRDGTIDSAGNEMAKYSDDFRAVLPEEQAEKYKSNYQEYGTAAEVAPVTVSSGDLPPPTVSTGALDNVSTAPSSDTVTSTNVIAAPSETVSSTEPATAEASGEKSWLSDILDSNERTPAPSIGKRDSIVTESPSSPPPADTSTGASSTQTEFIWPLRGKVISAFGTQGNDGINIASRSGEPIRASADGTVVYASNSIKEFGNMIIIQHSGGFLSAYGHASELVVKRGDDIIKGQLIGFVGQTGNVKQPQLHFSLRKDKQPVDPQKYLVNK